MFDSDDSVRDIALRIYSSQYTGTQAVVASVVHETNNILSILLGALESVQDLADDKAEIDREELKDEVQALRRNLQRLTGNMADLRKVYTTTKSGNKESNLQQAFVYVASIYDYQLKRNRIVYDMPEASNAIVTLSTSELASLFSIFFLNAVEAAQANADKTVYFNIRFSREANHEVVEFETIGACMKPEILKSLGQPFISDKSSDKHLGLGVFVAKELLIKHSGELKWEVENDKVKFRLLLPTKF